MIEEFTRILYKLLTRLTIRLSYHLVIAKSTGVKGAKSRKNFSPTIIGHEC